MTDGAARGPILARLDRPAGPDATVVILADAHVDAAREPGSWKCYETAADRLRTGFADADRIDADAVVVAGDLTRDGDPEAFDAFDDAATHYDGELCCVPGNHDVPKDYRDAPSVHAFRDAYTPGVLPYVRRVDAGSSRGSDFGLHVVGLDTASAVTDGAGGRITDAQLAWLDDTLPTVGEAVAVLHHPLTADEHRAGTTGVDHHPPVENADRLARVLATHDVPLAVSGHVHWPAVGERRGVREVVAPAVCSFPQAGLVLDVDPRGTTVSLLPLADRRGLEAAHSAAVEGTERARRIAANVRQGYLAEFPLVDDRSEPAAEAGNAGLVR